MELTAYRDGIFSSSDPIAAPGLTAFNDGTLGLGSSTRAFRDGVFSQSDPLARPGSILTSYSDGSLGALGATTKALDPKQCINWCMSVRGPLARAQCVKSCARSGRKRVKYPAGRAVSNPLAQKKRPVQGFGEISNTTLIGGAVAIGVIGLAVVMMGKKKGKRR